MRKIKMLLVILGFVSSFAFGQGLPLPYGYGGFKPGSEPDGFRGIKWGTDISTLSGMRYVRTEQGAGSIEVYIREGDELKIGDATLEKIEYGFWRGKFWGVLIYTKGFANFYNLKQAVFEKFGRGGQPNEYIEEYVWSGENTLIVLQYNKFSEIGSLGMFSQKISQQMEEYRRQKAKEGAEKGF